MQCWRNNRADIFLQWGQQHRLQLNRQQQPRHLPSPTVSLWPGSGCRPSPMQPRSAWTSTWSTTAWSEDRWRTEQILSWRRSTERSRPIQPIRSDSAGSGRRLSDSGPAALSVSHAYMIGVSHIPCIDRNYIPHKEALHRQAPHLTVLWCHESSKFILDR